MVLQDFYDGKEFEAYTFFGAHKENNRIVFRTYAPNAVSISVIGSFNEWHGEAMTQIDRSGVFVYESDKAVFGDLYKYKIEYSDGNVVDHCDPYGFGMELRPAHASVVTDISGYKWHDDEWMKRRTRNFNMPMSIYELHLGSWRTNPENQNGWYSYSEIADELISYVKKNGFTHIEFLPLSEHPADESWGYQNTGFYSPTSRYGNAKQLMELVDKAHADNIGVIMDFVPVHFAIDGYGLNYYDGSDLYNLPPGDVGNSEWGTLNFNHSRGETACYIQSCANYWLKEYHFDGIRMDAISRAIYWRGDPDRGVNQKAVDFISSMNVGLHQRHPDAMLIAEDSTSYLKVTAPAEYGGLGFDYKWDMGWMNDTLNYFRCSPQQRVEKYFDLVFSMEYFFKEHFILSFSHDEVVHGKATIIQKMWGDYEKKFPQARALYMYMFSHPGKKLNFMGNEIAQFREWDEKREQDWELLRYPLHDSFHRYFSDLNHLYLTYEELYKNEFNNYNFRWLESYASDKSVYVFEVGLDERKIISAFNFSDNDYPDYRFNAAGKRKLTELISSDYDIYSGSTTRKNEAVEVKYNEKEDFSSVSVHLPPFTGIMYLSENIFE
ncbi:MAG: 1,4-alpha-glucan branching protein GlgB [Ruminococcus sp.]|nr:1,4-alpha-glucan branching protein GlgB [Ruminococcus sp.]